MGHFRQFSEAAEAGESRSCVRDVEAYAFFVVITVVNPVGGGGRPPPAGTATQYILGLLVLY